tara:strand:- start:430445 stop:430642 length:198 start_codon:yes stop_codon:yes gene_type:complete
LISRDSGSLLWTLSQYELNTDHAMRGFFMGIVFRMGTKKPGVQLEGQTPSLVGVGRETVHGTANI